MAGIGPMELIIVLALALLVLGPKRLPDAGRSLGRGMREFKDSLTGSHGDDDDTVVAPTAEPSRDLVAATAPVTARERKPVEAT